MLRAKLTLVAIFMGIFMNMGMVVNASAREIDIDSSMVSEGIVRVLYNNEECNKAKLMIKKDSEKYYYNLANNDSYEEFSLQMGNGEYQIKIYENVYSTKYKSVFKDYLDVEIEEKEENDTFTKSIQNVKYDDEDKAIKIAKSLTEYARDDRERLELVHEYIVENIEYDYNKLRRLPYNYVPDNDQTLRDGSGICYDYASLLAAMLRSQGVPVKLVKGYSDVTPIYHAWNEVYVDGEWIIVDVTYDAVMDGRGIEYDIEKPADYYNKVREY